MNLNFSRIVALKFYVFLVRIDELSLFHRKLVLSDDFSLGQAILGSQKGIVAHLDEAIFSRRKNSLREILLRSENGPLCIANRVSKDNIHRGNFRTVS